MTHAAGRISLATVLVCATVTFGIGVAWKSPCASGNWSDTRQFTIECYSDIVPLFGTEQLAGGRLPYLDACTHSDANCDEYPVLTMYFMRAAASLVGPAAASLVGGSIAAFFWANALMLWLCALVIAACCYFMVGRRALYVALAPTLLLSGVLNWDLFAVALSCLGLLYFFTRRDVASGVFIGLGAAAKFFPALLVIPLVVDRLRSRERDRSINLAWSAAGAWLVTNIPFALVAFASWWEFFRFNSARPADFDSLWYITFRQLGGDATAHTKVINEVSAALFLGAVALTWLLKAHRHPNFPRWTLGFPILVLFLLTNKVYSPQYSLFLLPWFALALPKLRAFVLFQLAEILVYVSRFKMFAAFEGLPGASQALFEMTVVLRATVLIACVIVWIRYEASPLPIQLAATDDRPPGDLDTAAAVAEPARMQRPRYRASGVILLFAVTLTILGGSYWVKARCTNAPWDGRQWTHLCGNDIMVLYYENHYDVGQTFPPQHVEYPPLLVFYIAATREVASSPAGFFAANGLGLAVAGLVCVASLICLAPARRLWLFVLAPTFFLYAFLNWDLLAIALGLAGLVAASRRRYRLSGLLLGLGAAAKLFPALILPGVYLAARAEATPKQARRAVGAFLIGALTPNLILFLLSSSSWRYFWSFQSSRFPNPETSWFMVFRHLQGNPVISGWWTHGYPVVADWVGAILFVSIGGWLVVREARRGSPRAIELSFALTIVFLLFTKVFSPQYMLWLLPFLVLVELPWQAIFAFFLTDVTALVAVNAYFVSLVRSGDWPLHLDLLEVAVWSRYLVLIWLLWLVLRRSATQDPRLVRRSVATRRVAPKPNTLLDVGWREPGGLTEET